MWRHVYVTIEEPCNGAKDCTVEDVDTEESDDAHDHSKDEPYEADEDVVVTPQVPLPQEHVHAIGSGNDQDDDQEEYETPPTNARFDHSAYPAFLERVYAVV